MFNKDGRHVLNGIIISRVNLLFIPELSREGDFSLGQMIYNVY